jgi:peptidoglycan/LPS O-acetylase OafA/YrhL
VIQSIYENYQAKGGRDQGRLAFGRLRPAPLARQRKMKSLKVFILLTIAAGAFAVAGSALGAAVAHRFLFAGGISGGLIGCLAGASLARRFRWIPSSATKFAAVGACIGFVAAAVIALNTLHSPLGPILSSPLVGVGGLIGVHLVGHSSHDKKA